MPRNGLYNLNPYKINYDFGQKLDTSGLERAMALQNKWIEDNQNTENQLSDFVSSLNVSDYDKQELQNDYDKVLSEMRGLSSTLGLGRSVEYAQDAANAFKQKYSRYQQDYEKYNKVIEKAEAKNLKGDVSDDTLRWFKEKNKFTRNENGEVTSFSTEESKTLYNTPKYVDFYNTYLKDITPNIKGSSTQSKTQRGNKTVNEDGTGTSWQRDSGSGSSTDKTDLDLPRILRAVNTGWNLDSDFRSQVYQDYDVTLFKYKDLVNKLQSLNKDSDDYKRIDAEANSLKDALSIAGVIVDPSKDPSIDNAKKIGSKLEDDIVIKNFVLYRLLNPYLSERQIHQLKTTSFSESNIFTGSDKSSVDTSQKGDTRVTNGTVHVYNGSTWYDTGMTMEQYISKNPNTPINQD